MKNLTKKELLEAPAIIQYVYTAGLFGNQIGNNIYEEAIKKHPEYFADVLEYRAKWDAIPQEVHDAYEAELSKRFHESCPDDDTVTANTGKGFMYWAEHPKEMEIYAAALQAHAEIYNKLSVELYEKYYHPYGIKHHTEYQEENKNKQHDEQKERRQVRRTTRSRWDAIYSPRR